MDKVKISIIIIEYYSIEEIKRCISSIEKSCKNIPYEIIVSSNSMYDKELQKKILLKFRNIKWSFNNKNGGFAYGMNNGLAQAKGQYLVIANPDIEIVEGFGKMIDFMDSYKNIGIVAPQIKDNEGNIQDSCRDYVTIQSFFVRQIKRFIVNGESILSKQIDYSKIQTVDWVIGAFILIRKDIYIQSKGFDDKYFMYCEDMDWCTRVRKLGYEIVYYPKMQITYKGSRSARRSRKYMIIFIKSIITYWRKFGFFKVYPKRKKMEF